MKEITVDLYEKNRKKAKRCEKLAPIVFWVLIGISILLFAICIRHSIGNIIDICKMLDKDTHNGDELSANYAQLVEMYGEWKIGGSYGGVAINFINISKALVNGISIMSGICAIICFISAYILGKWFLPKWAKIIKEENQDAVNKVVLKNNTKE